MKDSPDSNTALYFIALVPHGSLRDEIREVKERMRDQFRAGHALKSPAHITLQRPFKRNPAEEGKMCSTLRSFALGEKPFTVNLNGYGAFVPRVIFIKIVDPDPIRSIHRRLRVILVAGLDFSRDEIMHDVQPHITVATRDLTREAFAEAWPLFMEEEFTGQFEVSSIYLLKHNNRDWDILEEFPFGGR
ncbi:MAG: 2'-5' RNA ligase family protein [Bacteroidales bacterium]